MVCPVGAGPLPDGFDESFTARDREHVGEEVTDVFIYCHRLCDVCHIDLASAALDYVRVIGQPHTPVPSLVLASADKPWAPCLFATVYAELEKKAFTSHVVRQHHRNRQSCARSVALASTGHSELLISSLAPPLFLFLSLCHTHTRTRTHTHTHTHTPRVLD